MSSLSRRLRALLFLSILPMLAAASVAAQSDAVTSFDAAWIGKPAYVQGANLTLQAAYPDTLTGAEPAAFTVEIMTTIPYEKSRVSMRVNDESGLAHHQAEMAANLHRGNNTFSFEWNASALAPGDYELVLEVDYADNFPTAHCTLPLAKVNGKDWEEAMARYDADLKALGNAVASNDSPTPPPTAATLRYRLIQDSLATARTAYASQAWHLVDRNMRYIAGAIPALQASLIFSHHVEDGAGAASAGPIQLSLEQGGFFHAGRPLFLFGQTVSADEDVDAQLARLRRYGLNAALATVVVSEATDVAAARIQTILDTAGRYGLTVAVQFNQEDVAGLMDQWPELAEPGFVNMAHADFQQAYLERLTGLLGRLSGLSGIAAVSIAQQPRFKYDGEAVRQAFIEQVRQVYPDRMDLNRIWRAHLADYDEIAIWGEHAEHEYPNRRAYQYEWQSFHRSRIAQGLARVSYDSAQCAPNIPLMLTLPATAFKTGETRYVLGLEEASAMMAVNGCTATMDIVSDLYAMNYPGPLTDYALLRSYAPGKPILNLNGDIQVDASFSPEHCHDFVATALWESVIGGLNGLVLPSNSALTAYPEAVEAFALTAMRINRLGDIVGAFQQTPAMIGVLFSEASKIMDNGVPHLDSARYAFEGASFCGFPIRFVTEAQVAAGILDDIQVLIMPDTPAVSDAAFERLAKYVEDGGMVARVGTPIPYNERGHSRSDVIRATGNTVLVRGMNLPTEYLHAMDAALTSGVLPPIPRPVNAFGYPLEGVHSRHVRYQDEDYLYIVNLRMSPVNCYLTSASNSGQDLIQGAAVDFPRILLPLEPMLIRMNSQIMHQTSESPDNGAEQEK